MSKLIQNHNYLCLTGMKNNVIMQKSRRNFYFAWLILEPVHYLSLHYSKCTTNGKVFIHNGRIYADLHLFYAYLNKTLYNNMRI